jgi:hypothetical protein
VRCSEVYEQVYPGIRHLLIPEMCFPESAPFIIFCCVIITRQVYFPEWGFPIITFLSWRCFQNFHLSYLFCIFVTRKLHFSEWGFPKITFMSCRVLDCFVDLETNANNRSRSSSRFNPEDMRSQTCQITPAHAAEDFYLDYFGGTSAYCAYCIPYAIKRFDKLFKLQEGVTAEIASSSPAAVTKPPLSITLESYLNLLRLGTPFKRTGDSIEITEQEQNNEPNESARTASPVATSIVQDQLLERADVDSEGCNYNFFPVDEKTYLVPPELPLMPVQKNALRITTRSSPALISLFVALGVAPDPTSASFLHTSASRK